MWAEMRWSLSLQLSVLLMIAVVSHVDAQELVGLGGIMRLRHTDDNESSYSWQLDYRENLSRHLAASFSYLNEGHVPDHHRDGHALQLWAKTDLMDNRLSLAAGAGPYYYFDTTVPSPGASYSNKHGFGGIFSVTATWAMENRWLFQVRTNWVETFNSIDTLSVLAGIGYQLEPPQTTVPDQSPSVLQGKTTENEITLFVGRTISNSFASEKSVSFSIEYRRGLWRYLDWTVAWLYEGNTTLIRRDGLAMQLWLVKAFLDDRIALGLGGGAYLAIDRHSGGGKDSSRSLSAIGTLTASYRFDPHWSMRTSWHRIITDYDRDTDVILGGIGYRF